MADFPSPPAPLVPVDRSQTGAIPKGNPNWVKGMASPNPSGRPQGLTRRVREMVDFDKAIETLVDIAWGKLAPASRVADRIKAIELLMDRGFGKAAQVIDIKDGAPVIADKFKQMPTDRLIATVEAMRALAAGGAPSEDASDAGNK